MGEYKDIRLTHEEIAHILTVLLIEKDNLRYNLPKGDLRISEDLANYIELNKYLVEKINNIIIRQDNGS
jgi:hypothetical protein